MKILHLIRNRNDQYALELAWTQSQQPDTEVIVLLLHDAVLTTLNTRLKTYACQADIIARGIISPYEALDYAQIVELIFECDRVITW